MTRSYLRYVRMASFGAVSNRTVGPFEPGLNIVFGKNEAGKTTLASFIEGVLFGWEEARGSRNTYKPEAAERAGSLFFADTENALPESILRQTFIKTFIKLPGLTLSQHNSIKLCILPH